MGSGVPHSTFLWGISCRPHRESPTSLGEGGTNPAGIWEGKKLHSGSLSGAVCGAVFQRSRSPEPGEER